MSISCAVTAQCSYRTGDAALFSYYFKIWFSHDAAQMIFMLNSTEHVNKMFTTTKIANLVEIPRISQIRNQEVAVTLNLIK